MENYKDQLIDIVRKYHSLNSELREIESSLLKLQSKHKHVRERKEKLCKLEKSLINKIESELGRSVTLTEIYKMINQSEPRI